MKYQRIIRTYQRSFFLLGPRGTGKSTFIDQKYGSARKINLLDEVVYQDLLTDPGSLSAILAQHKRGDWVIIDEVQRLPSLLNEVHRYIEKEGLKFVLCGSSARKLRRSGVNLLGGRASESRVFPFTPFEYGSDFSIEQSLEIGDIPLVRNDPDPKEALNAYIRLYLKEEIQAEAVVRNLGGFSRFLQIAALMNAQVLNVSSLARDSGVKRNTIDNYLSVLEDTLMGFRLPAFESKLRVKERSHPKLYLFDCGVVRALKKKLAKVDEDEKGFLFETWFANYLRAMQSYKNLCDDFFYWAAADAKAEVDFLLKKDSAFVAIEVKSGTRTRPEYFKGLKAISALHGLKRRILVYLGAKKLLIDGIECLPLADFINEFEQGKLF